VSASSDKPELAAKDFKSDQQVKWCPGCGDHSVLVQVQKVLAALGARREQTVFVSGMLESLSLLHGHIRLSQHPRPRAGDRDRG
jgi:pyruvate/2-oxoacid:ferredoxin oxidoreductase beta subunit